MGRFRRFLRRAQGRGAALWEVLSGRAERDSPTGWFVQESIQRARMRPALRWYSAFSKEVEAVGFDTMRTVPDPATGSALFRVHTTLGVRVLQDLRMVGLCALNGYIMQSWTVASSAFEAANLMGYVANDPDRANQWLEYSNTTRPFVGVKDAIRGCLMYLGLGETQQERDQFVENEYSFYSQLCMAKHINPMPEKNRYWVRAGSNYRLILTPYYTPAVVRQAEHGLALACRAGVIAAWVFARSHHEEADVDDVRFAQLAAKSVEGFKRSGDR